MYNRTKGGFILSFEHIVYQHEQELSEMDRGIIQYILENRQETLELNIIELADRVHVSKSSVLRFTKKLGFSGFSEFRYFLKNDQSTKQNSKVIEETVYAQQMKDIKQTLEYLHTIDLTELNQHLYQSKTIYCYSTGFSQKKALEEFGKMMLSLGKRVLIIPNKTELDMAMPMITKEDCLIIASVSGETENIKENFSMLQIRQIPTITLTLPGNNFFAQHSSFHLHYYCTPFLVSATHQEFKSLISLNCLVDYLFRSYSRYQSQEET